MKQLQSVDDILKYMIDNIEDKATCVVNGKERIYYGYFFLCSFIDILEIKSMISHSSTTDMRIFFEKNRPTATKHISFYEYKWYSDIGSAWWILDVADSISRVKELIQEKKRFLIHLKKEYYEHASK